MAEKHKRHPEGDRRHFSTPFSLVIPFLEYTMFLQRSTSHAFHPSVAFITLSGMIEDLLFCPSFSLNGERIYKTHLFFLAGQVQQSTFITSESGQ